MKFELTYKKNGIYQTGIMALAYFSKVKPTAEIVAITEATADSLKPGIPTTNI